MKLSLFAALPLTFLLFACTPEADTAQIKQAEQLRKAGNAAEAINLLRGIEKKTPDDPAVLQPLGASLLDAGQPEQAAATFDHLIAVTPGNAAGYGGKGIALDHLGDHEGAQAMYEKALAITPDAVSVQNNLAMSMILNRQFDEAIALLEKLRETHDKKTIRQNLALAYALKGDKKKALELNLIDLTPEEAKENMKFYESYRAKLKKEKR